MFCWHFWRLALVQLVHPWILIIISFFILFIHVPNDGWFVLEYICIGKYISCFEITIFFQIQENEFNLYSSCLCIYRKIYNFCFWVFAERLDSLFYYYTCIPFFFFFFHSESVMQSAKSSISLLWVKEVWYYFKGFHHSHSCVFHCCKLMHFRRG